MKSRNGWLLGLLAVACVLAVGGCARTAKDTQGFATKDAATVNSPLKETWQITKAVLREKGYDIYTRDKRGVFVAFTEMRRNIFLMPHRTKYTVALEAAGENSTQITVESVRQVYGVTLLTYPGWHDRKTEDHSGALAIIKAVQGKAGGSAAVSAGEPTTSTAPLG
jgi:hypothetical protein